MHLEKGLFCFWSYFHLTIYLITHFDETGQKTLDKQREKEENLWRRGASPAGETKNDESQWRRVRPCWTSLREEDENLW